MARDLVLEVIEQVRGNALGEAAKDLDQVAAKTDVAAGSAKEYSGELKSLDTQIASTRLKIQQLGAEFVATGEKATGKELRGERSLLGQLQRIRKELEDAAPDLAPAGAAIGAAMGGKAGSSFAGSMLEMVGTLPSKLRGIVLVGVVGAAAAAAPAIGASIAGAVVGTVGAGGIAGGIAAASRDPGVRAAASAFGQSISDEFFSGGQSFVDPTIESLGILEQAFKDMDLGDSWARVAPYVTTVAQGIGDMGREFMPGFNRALDAAGPGLVLLAQQLPEIGGALGDMVGDISESEGALEGLLTVLKLVEGTIIGTGKAVTWLSDEFHRSIGRVAAVSGFVEDLPIYKAQFWLTGTNSAADFNDKLEALQHQAQGAKGGLDGIGDALPQATRGMYAQGDAAHALAAAVRKLHDEYSDFLGVQLGVDQANRRFSEGLLDLNKTLKDNGKDWRDNTEAGLENQAALTAAVAGAIAIRDAEIAASGKTAEATAQFHAQLDVLTKLAVAAGISKEKLQDLIGDYRINVHVTTTGESTYSRALARAADLSRLGGFQHGGDPPMGEPFWVGEAGAELMRLTPRPHVYSHQQSKAMTAGSARQTEAALTRIVAMLEDIQKRPPTVNNVTVNAPQGMSPKEMAAVVSRELAWSR